MDSCVCAALAAQEQGASVLMLEAAPASAPATIKHALEASAQGAGPGRSDGYGAGRVDALAALIALGPRLADRSAAAKPESQN